MISPSDRSDAPEGEVIDAGSPGALGTTFPVHPPPEAEPPEAPSTPTARPAATVIAAPEATTVSGFSGCRGSSKMRTRATRSRMRCCSGQSSAVCRRHRTHA